VIFVNVFANPYGFYGEKSLGQAVIFNAQMAKYSYLKQRLQKPDAYVLGSSNAMRMKPETIDRLFNTRSFNYAVYQASIEDFFAIAHAVVEDIKAKPKLFIICVDDWNFRQFVPAKDAVFRGSQNRLSYKPALSKYLKDFSWTLLTWARLKSALSSEQLFSSFGLINEAIAKNDFNQTEPLIGSAFYESGVRKKYLDNNEKDITDLAESGQYHITDSLRHMHNKELARNHKGLVNGSHEDFVEFDKSRLALLGELVTYLSLNDIKVILNIMPIQPYFSTLVNQFTGYTERIRSFKSGLDLLATTHPNVLLVKDNSNIKNFNGHSQHFFDHLHPTSVNSDSMLMSIKRELRTYAF
jgi:hypothetical protein